MTWDPDRYLTFADERGRPFFDLVGRIPATAPGRVVDLGCGPGNLTDTLARRWPEAEVAGYDWSPDMIAAATREPGPVRYEVLDLDGWLTQGERADVVVSNAMLQWVPAHLELLPRIVDTVEPGGWLAFQVPGNFGEPSHMILRELADEDAYAALTAGVAYPDAHDAATYLRELQSLGCAVDAWETTYLHVLHGPDPVFTWISGTGARPVLAALGDDVVPVAPVIAFPETVSSDARIREQAVLAADLAELGDSLVNLQKQVAQKAATRQRLNMSIAFQTDLIKTLQDRVSVRQEAIKLAVGTKINLFDALESLDKSRSSLASDRGQLIETEAAIVELDSRKRRLISQFIADNTTKLADAQKKRDESTQQLAKAEAKLAHTRLVSPIEGTVQQLAVTTIGQVVTPGQQLMAIVPSHAPLVVEAYVGNGDIGFIHVGQPAAVKIDAFPFTRYGSMAGTVTEIASEAMEESEARRRQANASAVISPSSASATPAGQPQAFVFPVTIALASQAMEVDGIKRPLVPGMTVTTEIRTERRRVIDYLFSPLARTASEAMRER